MLFFWLRRVAEFEMSEESEECVTSVRKVRIVTTVIRETVTKGVYERNGRQKSEEHQK